ncbi:MAG TPA: hypothetical protein VFT87_03785 [Candidatus Saccharimonadales bacterium]|nr:hypothetical protein [Candidatus Saccharimonadales bacterium]
MPKNKANEPDGVYFLKIVLYLVAGFFWVRFSSPIHLGDFSINAVPLGLLIGILFAHHEHFQLDRKVEYAVLLVATIVSFFLPTGIII